MATQATYTLVSPPTPGLDPPPGVIPTFHQPYTLQPYVELTISLAIIVTTILMVARIYVKVWIVKKLLIEDHLCVIGWVSFHLHAFLPLIMPFARAINDLFRFKKSCNGIHERKPSNFSAVAPYAKRPSAISLNLALQTFPKLPIQIALTDGNCLVMLPCVL